MEDTAAIVFLPPIPSGAPLLLTSQYLGQAFRLW
jgi:hypothetical protein